MKLHSHNHRAFTLFELLIVIGIIGVLTAMSLGVMASARDDAKTAATRSRIKKIESMLQMEMENYEVRRLPIARSALGAGNNLKTMRDRKNQIIAELINTELPRPRLAANGTDYMPLTNGPGTIGQFPVTPGFLPSLNLQNYESGAVKQWEIVAARPNANKFNLPGEYLYEILSRIDYDGVSGIESFGNAAIGDSDRDQVPEMIDAWGKPLKFEIQQVTGIDAEGHPIYGPLDTNTPTPINKIRFVVSSEKLIGE